MPLLEELEANPDKERDGVWVFYGRNLWVCIRPYGTPEYQRRIDRATKPFRRKIQQEGHTGPAMTKCIKLAASFDICVNWGTDANGKKDALGEVIKDAEPMLDPETGEPVSWSQPKAYEIFSNPRYRSFWTFINSTAVEEETFRDSLVEDAAEN